MGKQEKILTDPSYRAAVFKQIRRDMKSTEARDPLIKKMKFEARMKLKADFPSAFDQMGKQVDAQRRKESKRQSFNKVAGFDLDTNSDDFICMVAGIILQHRHRYALSRRRGVEECFEATSNADSALATLYNKLRDLDPDASQIFRNSVIEIGRLVGTKKLGRLKVPKLFKLEFGYWKLKLLQEIADLKETIEFYSAAILWSLGEQQDGKKLKKLPIRPRSPHVAPAVDLIRAWYDLTGRQASSAKNAPKNTQKKATDHVAQQPSTEFVRQALMIIDDSLTSKESAAKAATAIISALAYEKKKIAD